MHGRTRQLGLAWGGTTPAAAQSSYEAAVFAERTAADDCAVLLRFIESRGALGVTDAEVEKALGWQAHICSARRNDLVNRGLVVQPVPYARARRQSVKTKNLRVSVWIAASYAAFW